MIRRIYIKTLEHLLSWAGGGPVVAPVLPGIPAPPAIPFDDFDFSSIAEDCPSTITFVGRVDSGGDRPIEWAESEILAAFDRFGFLIGNHKYDFISCYSSKINGVLRYSVAYAHPRWAGHPVVVAVGGVSTVGI